MTTVVLLKTAGIKGREMICFMSLSEFSYNRRLFPYNLCDDKYFLIFLKILATPGSSSHRPYDLNKNRKKVNILLSVANL